MACHFCQRHQLASSGRRRRDVLVLLLGCLLRRRRSLLQALLVIRFHPFVCDGCIVSHASAACLYSCIARWSSWSRRRAVPGCASEMASQREASSSEGIAWREPDSLLGVAAGVLPRHLWLGTADQGSLRRGVRSSCRVCTHAPPPGLAAAHRVDLLRRRVKTETQSVAILAQAIRR